MLPPWSQQDFMKENVSKFCVHFNTAATGYAREHAASGDHEAVRRICALTSWLNIRAEQHKYFRYHKPFPVVGHHWNRLRTLSLSSPWSWAPGLPLEVWWYLLLLELIISNTLVLHVWAAILLFSVDPFRSHYLWDRRGRFFQFCS